MNATGRCDDGSNDRITSFVVAQEAALKRIGRLKAIKPIATQVALSSSDKAKSFQHSRVRNVPRLVMELSSGHLILADISFLVSDAALANKDVLIGLPVFQYVFIASHTLLKRSHKMLDCNDYFPVQKPSVYKTCGLLRPLITALHQRVSGHEPSDHDDPK